MNEDQSKIKIDMEKTSLQSSSVQPKVNDDKTSTNTKNSKPYSANSIEFFLRISDIFAIIIASLVSYVIFTGRIEENVAAAYMNVTAISLIISNLTIGVVGGYDSQVFFSLRSSFKSAILGWGIAIAFLLVMGFAFKVTDVFSRLWVGNWVLNSIILILFFRGVIWFTARKLRKNKTFDSRAVIVGAGNQGLELYNYINNNEFLTISVIGFADDRTERVANEINGVPVIGGMGELVKLIRAGSVDQVLVSLPWSAKERLRQIVDCLAENPIKIRLAPDLAGFEYLNREFTSLGGLPVMNLFDRPLSGYDSFIKSMEDYIFGSIAFLFALPVMLIVAIAVKLDSKGPIFFMQDREGFNNKTFKVWKFRSMNVTEGDEITQVSVDGKRITKVGAFLRKTSLDELPQLLNVLKGDMSLVGPRPHAPSTKAAGIRFEEAVSRYAARHRVKPGITGWAQVNGWRGETDTVEKLEQRLHHDLYYIDHWSLGLDLKILTKTVFVAWSQEAAY